MKAITYGNELYDFYVAPTPSAQNKNTQWCNIVYSKTR
jgi:hypothetical protein